MMTLVVPGPGLVERPGFQKLVAAVCAGSVGAVVCIEASRLARNGRDWHRLIDLCALVSTVVIDPDGVYDPRLVNDRLLLGLKGAMSEYELRLLRQRGLAARDSKAQRGELKFALPPRYCWGEAGPMEMDPDERVCEAIRLVLRKFGDLGSARQVLLWTVDNGLQLPVMHQVKLGAKIESQAPAYHTVRIFCGIRYTLGLMSSAGRRSAPRSWAGAPGRALGTTSPYQNGAS